MFTTRKFNNFGEKKSNALTVSFAAVAAATCVHLKLLPNSWQKNSKIILSKRANGFSFLLWNISFQSGTLYWRFFCCYFSPFCCCSCFSVYLLFPLVWSTHSEKWVYSLRTLLVLYIIVVQLFRLALLLLLLVFFFFFRFSLSLVAQRKQTQRVPADRHGRARVCVYAFERQCVFGWARM